MSLLVSCGLHVGDLYILRDGVNLCKNLRIVDSEQNSKRILGSFPTNAAGLSIFGPWVLLIISWAISILFNNLFCVFIFSAKRFCKNTSLYKNY